MTIQMMNPIISVNLTPINIFCDLCFQRDSRPAVAMCLTLSQNGTSSKLGGLLVLWEIYVVYLRVSFKKSCLVNWSSINYPSKSTLEIGCN
jgi:hypothetical protein